tara:strand:+ start:1026 stop:1412 length:387 start_codon:yes stop_codon:yes gene_type:complete
MKLIENFQQLLDADELPHRFSNWWIIEDADQMFDSHPFHPRGWQYPKLRHFFKNTKRDIGFYRKKNTANELRLQKIFIEQFDEELVDQLFSLFEHQSDERNAREYIKKFKGFYSSGLNGIQVRDLSWQ